MTEFYFLLPSKGRFLSNFDNEELKAQADLLWRQLDGTLFWLFFGALVLGILIAYVYYGPFNERPGRHYQIKWWVLFVVITLGVTLLSSVALEYTMTSTHLKSNVASLFWLCALNNAIYGIVIYLIVSVIY
jgi:uncharacterized membrane protein